MTNAKLTPEQIHELIVKAQERKANRPLNVTSEEGMYIQYQLKLKGYTYAGIAAELDCSRVAVQRVVTGQAHSRRIEKEVASVLGYESWNTMLKTIRTVA